MVPLFLGFGVEKHMEKRTLTVSFSYDNQAKNRLKSENSGDGK